MAGLRGAARPLHSLRRLSPLFKLPIVRSTEWSAALVESPDSSSLVSVDTQLPNRLIERALEAGALEELAGWRLERREHTVGHSRFDFLLHRRHGGRGPRQMALEVKSVTLVENRS